MHGTYILFSYIHPIFFFFFCKTPYSSSLNYFFHYLALTSQRRQLQEDKSTLAKRVEEMLGSERERSKYQESVVQEIEESRAERAKFEAMAMEYREKRDLVHQKYLEYKERCVEVYEIFPRGMILYF